MQLDFTSKFIAIVDKVVPRNDESHSAGINYSLARMLLTVLIYALMDELGVWQNFFNISYKLLIEPVLSNGLTAEFDFSSYLIATAPYYLGALLLFPAIYISMILHEFGHALCGLLCGLKIKSITIGAEGIIYQKQFSWVLIKVGRGFDGFCSYDSSSKNITPFKRAVFMLGGFFVDIAVFILVYQLSDPSGASVIEVFMCFLFGLKVFMFPLNQPDSINVCDSIHHARRGVKVYDHSAN